ncbi:FtsK/SpoIIIE domain-containing protein [Pseudonocardia broussonetiae]|uniref:FHA domain-containing protein n=1 Tax=Pseudonocardia broussonetiae TaxID=2736640 RepID=A0A6M6JLX8_9PSEU|nr:FtsK/SpoIIIE domain-containing protein [Pseudonocardia broussonetiae]QJY47937.1 FHA domain-containing protein [Pseudonocardia broussonetiae]
MRVRITVVDGHSGLRTDVFLECHPADPVGAALGPLVRDLALPGAPTIEGLPVDLAAPVVDVLADGVLVGFGNGAAGVRPAPAGLVLRVVSGPSAGRSVALPEHGAVEIGRSSAAQLVLDDPDVSRRHAVVTTAGESVTLSDLGSNNGVFVDGDARPSAHPLRTGEVVQLGGSRLLLESTRQQRAPVTRDGQGAVLINRRFPDRRTPFAAPTVTLPTRPHEQERRGLPLLPMMVPAAMSIVMALVLGSPLYLLFGLMSPLLVGGNWWTERRRRAGIGATQDSTYAEALQVARAAVERAVADEDADAHRRLPDPMTVAGIAVEPRVELWSRRPGEDEWLSLRFGTADRPAAVQVMGEKPADWVEPVLVRVPVGVDLDAVGVLGLAGPGEWLGARLDWLLVQCAVLHSPDELRMVVLAPGADEKSLGWLRWLPHVRDSGGGVLVAWDADGVEDLVRQLTRELDRRAEQARAHRGGSVEQVLVMLTDSGELAHLPAVVDLLTRGPALGFRLICTDTDDRRLPDSCRAVLIGGGGRSELRLDRGAQTTLLPDALAAGQAETVARRLAPMRRVGDRPAAGLPDSVRYAEVQPLPDIEGIRAAWRIAPERTEVVVGRDADGPAVLDIAVDGPHALVAGTSGAGKSELLQTWTAALALANTPERLSMLFVDYKGGAAFKDLDALPHRVGSVTNLDDRLAARALASLHNELRRRQQQLAAAGAADRGDYLRRAAGQPHLPPFPRLLIIVDELAELKEQLPDMVDGLVNVARIGRSLGVHLVLATQRPAGVIDSQIRANVGLRVCLRTATASDSLDVVDVPTAADIPADRPGRALVLRGGPPVRVLQTARITTPLGAVAEVVRRTVPVRWDDVAAPVLPAEARDGLRTDLDELVAAIGAAAAQEGLAAPFRPFTDPLPTVVTLDRMSPAAGVLPIGARDALHRHEPLHVPLGSGHLAIVGSARTGRTAALRAVAVGLAAAMPPDALHLHVIDPSGGLAGLAALPHVGVIADVDDAERLERLLHRLLQLVRERRKQLGTHGASTIAELPGTVPHVVLLVDGWSGLTDTADSGASAAMHDLLGGGGTAAAGVTVCLAGDERLLKARLLGRVEHRLCLRLNTPSDGVLLGLDIRNQPAGLPAGRALWAADGSEVQVPLLAADVAGPAQAAALAAFGAELHARWSVPDGQAGPLRLDPLPEGIGFDDAVRLGPVPARSILLGVRGDRLAPLWCDLDGLTGHLVVAGPPRSGRSTALAALTASAQLSGARAGLVSSRPGPVHRAAAERGVVLLGPLDLVAGADSGFDLLAVDDLESLTLDDAVVARLCGPDQPRLAVVLGPEAGGFTTKGLLRAVRSRLGPIVLLSPPAVTGPGYLDVKLARTDLFIGPPGRAHLVVDGQPVLGQVPDLTGL